MPVDPFAMLELDHRHVEAILEQLAHSDEGAQRNALLKDLEASLTAHMQFEEQAVYPLVIEEMDRETEREAEIEHGLARDGLAKLMELAAAPGFGAAVEMLTGGISHHVKEEEGQIFPKLRQGTDDAALERLADELIASKKAAGLPIAPPEAPKNRLLELAQQMDIDGRSSMTRDELAAAIAAAS